MVRPYAGDGRDGRPAAGGDKAVGHPHGPPPRAAAQAESRPRVSSRRSHTSLTVGYDGTACHRRFTGTSPTIAIVAECSHEGRADEHAAVEVDDRAGFAGVGVGLLAGTRDAREVVIEDLDVQALLVGLLRGETDGSHFGVGEGDLGDGIVVGGGGVGAPGGVIHLVALRAGGDDIAGGARLVLALVGQQCAVIDVAHGVQPVGSSHAQRVVDVEPRAGGEPHGIQSEILRARGAPDRDEDLVGGHRRAVGEVEDHATVVVAAGGRRVGAGLHGRAPLAQGGCHQLARERFVAAEQARAGDDRDLAAEALEGGRHLGPDDAATDDRERGRDLLHRGGLAARPGGDVGQARDVGQESGGPRADRDGVTRDEVGGAAVGGGDAHGLLAGESSVSADEVDSGALQPLHLARVVPVARHRVAAAQDRGDV